MVVIRNRQSKFAKKAGQGIDAPSLAPPTRHCTTVEKTLHDTAQDWGLHPELLKAWNPGATFEPGSVVFIDPPEAS
jgi:hypothetical protein